MKFNIYEMKSDPCEERPQINFDDPRTNVPWQDENSKEFDLYDAIQVGDSPIQPIDLVMWTFDGRGANWDLFYNAGKMGLWSERLFLEFAKYANGALGCMPAKVDNRHFCVPIRQKSIDCFDRERSQFEVFPSNPSRIMMFDRFAFHTERLHDPLAFCIPESMVDVFAPSGVKDAIESLNPVGIEFKLLDTALGTKTMPQAKHKRCRAKSG